MQEGICNAEPENNNESSNNNNDKEDSREGNTQTTSS